QYLAGYLIVRAQPPVRPVPRKLEGLSARHLLLDQQLVVTRKFQHQATNVPGGDAGAQQPLPERPEFVLRHTLSLRVRNRPPCCGNGQPCWLGAIVRRASPGDADRRRWSDSRCGVDQKPLLAANAAASAAREHAAMDTPAPRPVGSPAS